MAQFPPVPTPRSLLPPKRSDTPLSVPISRPYSPVSLARCWLPMDRIACRPPPPAPQPASSCPLSLRPPLFLSPPVRLHTPAASPPHNELSHSGCPAPGQAIPSPAPWRALKGKRAKLSMAPATTMSRECTLHKKWSMVWRDIILSEVKEGSGVYCSLQGTKHLDEHLLMALRRYKAKTLSRHIPVWRDWSLWCTTVGVVSWDPSVGNLCDYFQEIRQGARYDRRRCKKLCSVKNIADGLVFMANTAEMSRFSSALSSSVLSGLAYSPEGKERKEAWPLPLGVVVRMEALLLGNSENSLETWQLLVIGGWLTCIWASLRYGDAQRSMPAAISLDASIMRSSCWSTKTSRGSMPFAIIAQGFLSTSTGPSWCKVYLQHMQQWIRLAEGEPESLDFLFPDIISGREDSASLLARPAPYMRMLLLFRNFLMSDLLGEHAIPHDEVHNYTLHSLKVTMLSWGKQLDLKPEWRAEQGHHAIGGSSSEVRRYGRDDVYGSIEFQKAVRHVVLEGWRPLRSVQRGAVAPLPEPVVSITPLLSPSAGSSSAGPPSAGSSSAGPLSSSSSSASFNDSLKDERTYLANVVTGKYHVALQVDISNPTWDPNYVRGVMIDGTWWTTPCQAKFAADSWRYQLLADPPDGYDACSAAGCRALFR